MQANTMQVRTVKNSFFTLSTWSKQWCFQCIYAYVAHDDGYSYTVYCIFAKVVNSSNWTLHKFM